MNDIPVNPNNMVETSDSLEAVGVFRTWKNIFFVVLLVCLLLTQAIFWATDLGFVQASEAPAAAAETPAPPANEPVTEEPAAEQPADRGFLGGVR